jgi:4,5-DOPA dioxygenase extradiol
MSFSRRRLVTAAPYYALIAGGAAVAGCGRRSTHAAARRSPQMSDPSPPIASRRMPVLFVGHGSPMNAIEDTPWSQGFRAMAGLVPANVKAVLCVSAHWFVAGTFTTGNEQPKTIHDFGGFPDELFAMQYPARGDVTLARRVVELLGPARASVRLDWGLDHGTWTVLHHMRPAADLPVVQLSIDGRMPPAGHLELGRALAPLRDEGVLILGSGNITHNLRYAIMHYQSGDVSLPDWAASFDRDVAHALEQHDGKFLADTVRSDAGRMSHPTLDHYLPLLYAAGAAAPDDKVSFPATGFDLGSLSMRSVLFG